jgi:hypothetical protein
MLHLIVEFCSIAVKTRTLKVVLESNNGNQQGWDYAIDKVEHLSYDALIPFFWKIQGERKNEKSYSNHIGFACFLRLR